MVEDNPVNQVVLRHIPEKSGYEADVAADDPEGVDRDGLAESAFDAV